VSVESKVGNDAAEQRDAADEGRLEASGSITVGSVIVSEGKVVRPSPLIASVLRTTGGAMDARRVWQQLILSACVAAVCTAIFGTRATAQDAGGTPGRKSCQWPAALDAPTASPENHRIVFENERVRVLDVIVAVGGREALHAHCWPSVLYVTFRGKLREWGADGKLIREVKETPPPTAFPLTQWLDASPPHSIENLDTQPIHLLRIELKQ